MTDQNRFPVQFCPCGHVLHLTREEFENLGGNAKRFDDPRRMSAPTLPSEVCDQCIADQEDLALEYGIPRSQELD